MTRTLSNSSRRSSHSTYSLLSVCRQAFSTLAKSNVYVPASGLHPWWSHHISFEAADQVPSKLEHYAQLFPSWFASGDVSEEAQSLLDSFPNPTSCNTFAKEKLRPYLEAFPSAMLGEVGLDRSFRIPYPQTDAKSNRADHKISKKFTELKTPVEHQVRLLREQMEIAFSLDRNVSMHSVQAQGATVELLSSLARESRHWTGSKSKICLHSYGGSVETIGQIMRIHPRRVYFSFSTTINARLDRLEALIEATPDDRLLIESDYNDVRKSEARVWEILGIVCQAKAWTKEKAVGVLAANWKAFSGEA